MSCDGLEGQSPPAYLRWRAYGHVLRRRQRCNWPNTQL